jgi:hypothetical protein
MFEHRSVFEKEGGDLGVITSSFLKKFFNLLRFFERTCSPPRRISGYISGWVPLVLSVPPTVVLDTRGSWIFITFSQL